MKALDNNENNEILEENAENQDELVLDEDIELDKDMGSLFAGAQRPHPRGGWHRAAMTGGVCLRKNKTSGTAAPEVCGRGSKSRTHGTRFWRPLLYQLSYTPIYLSHSLNA